MRMAGRPDASVAAASRTSGNGFARGKLIQIDRRVEPLQQVLPQRRSVAHQLDLKVYGSMKSVELVT